MGERAWADGDGEVPGWLRSEMRQVFARPSILLVEDDRDIRELLTTLLQLAGFDATPCESAEQGLQQLREGSFDLVLTDYMLPHRSGAWLLQQASEEGLLDSARALVVTAHPAPADVDGFEIIQKPFDLDDVVSRVRQRLEGQVPRPKLPMMSPRASARAVDEPAGSCSEPVELILYVSAQSPRSAQAVSNVKRVLTRFSPAQVRLTVCDLSVEPHKGAEDSIAFTPTLVRRSPGPRTFILGHISNPEVVAELLADCVEES